MNYKALYRKYRPQGLEGVVGQEHIVKTLTNQIQNQRVAHAYLFTGSRGTGKTSIAKIFAHAVNCETPINGSACKTCATCKSVASGEAINIIEMDAASNNGVDNIRNINEEVMYTPAVGKYKVYIIDEVHMLSTGAFNALLKTLEEPPAHVIFILATTDPQKIPVTILSRCQRYDFRRLTMPEISGALKKYMELECVDIEDAAVDYIARLADGGMRDALSILEQCMSFFFEEKITYEKVLKLLGAVDNGVLFDTIDAIIKSDSTKLIEICEDINIQGRNLKQFVNDLVTHMRNVMVANSTKNGVGVLDYSVEHIERLNNQAKDMSMNTAKVIMKELSKLEQEIKNSTNQKASLEVGLLNMCDLQMPELHEKHPSENLVARVYELEAIVKQLVRGGFLQTEKVEQEKSSLITEFTDEVVEKAEVLLVEKVEISTVQNEEVVNQEQSVEVKTEDAQSIKTEQISESVVVQNVSNQKVKEEGVESLEDMLKAKEAETVVEEAAVKEEGVESLEDMLKAKEAETIVEEAAVKEEGILSLEDMLKAKEAKEAEEATGISIKTVSGQIENMITEVKIEFPSEPTPVNKEEFLLKQDLFKQKLSIAGKMVLSRLELCEAKDVAFTCEVENLSVATVIKEEFERVLSELFGMPKSIEIIS